MSSTVEKIKARLNIVEVVGSYLKLEKAGANLRGRCPFHNEKTPSFFVSPARDTYHCFGCGKGGDLINFVEEIEGLDFLGALKVLAERAGVELESFSSPAVVAEKSEKEKLYQILAAGANFFSAELKRQSPVMEYLRGRGVSEQTTTDFKIGFAPDAWRTLSATLTGRGYPAPFLVKAGLAIQSAKSAGGIYDRFRNRIMFPINDSSGRVVGFSGRIFGQAVEEVAKYVNTPETPLYQKSKILFGYDRARTAMRRADRVVLVEGQFDLVMSHQAAVPETVAVSGTALSVDHLRLLKRLTTNLVMAFDPDPAGFRASGRAINLALAEGFEVRLVDLPDGLDPADLIKQSSDKWRQALANSRHVIDFLSAVLTKREPDRRRRAHLFATELYPFIVSLAKRTDRAYFIKQAADNLGLNEETIALEVAEAAAKNLSVDERQPSGLPSDRRALTASPPRREKLSERILGLIWWQESLATPSIDLVEWKNRLADFFSTGGVNWSAAAGEEERRRLILGAELAYGGSERLADDLVELEKEWRLEKLRGELGEALIALRAAEAAGDNSEIDKWLKKCQDISRLINNSRQIKK